MQHTKKTHSTAAVKWPPTFGCSTFPNFNSMCNDLLKFCTLYSTCVFWGDKSISVVVFIVSFFVAQDGVDNTDVDSSRLYTQPEEVWQVYETLSAVPNGNFTVAAAFGNVHGVYAPGNVSLKPVILHNTQKYIKDTDSVKRI